MADVVAGGDAAIVIAHSLAQPRTQLLSRTTTTSSPRSPRSCPSARQSALDHGIPAERIIVDPGHDLNKNTLHSLELTRRLGELTPISAARCWSRCRTRTSSARAWIATAASGSPDRSPPRSSASCTAPASCACTTCAQTVDAMRMVEAILGWREPVHLVHNMRPEGND